MKKVLLAALLTLSVGALTQTNKANDIMAKASKAVENLKSLKGTITVNINFKQGEVAKQLYYFTDINYVAPNKLFAATTNPSNRAMDSVNYADGQVYYQYIKSQNVYSKKTIVKTANPILGDRVLGQFVNSKSLERYNFKLTGTAEMNKTPVYIITAELKNQKTKPGETSKNVLYIGQKDFIIRSVVMEGQKQGEKGLETSKVEIRIKNLAINEKIDPKVFKWSLPSDAKEIKPKQADPDQNE